MFVIASNISTRDKKVEHIFEQAKAAAWNTGSGAAETLTQMAKECAAAGADALEINLQQHYDRPEAMEFAVRVIEPVIDRQLCLSTNHVETLEAGLRASKRPPIANYLSIDELKLKEMLPVISNHKAWVVLLVSDPAAPGDTRDMLQKTAILVGAANEAGIANENILVDPGLIHVTGDTGQRHLVEVLEFLRTLPDATEPPVKSTCWLTNSSAGAPQPLRPVIERALLPMLAGAGLTSVFMDILRKENRQEARLVKIFNNEVVYSDNELEV